MANNSSNAGSGQPMLQTDSKTLWVGDIESWMDETYISNVFSKIGPVLGVKLIRDKQTGAPTGYGFVEFASHEIAARVLQQSNGALNSGGNK
jgi:RNA recognition motif-containing protein